MKVAVLGCGPTGLMAADYLENSGHTVHVYSKKSKSIIAGAQFLHRHMGWYTTPKPDFKIQVVKVGTKEGYARNVYDDPNAPVSWDDFQEGVIDGWNLAKAYEDLWTIWETHIEERIITSGAAEHLAKWYDMVFSSVPAFMMCNNIDHKFNSQKILVGVKKDDLIDGVNDGDMMYYNGHWFGEQDGIVGPPYYRYSQINKIRSWEYAEHAPLVLDRNMKMVKLTKPLSTNCDCMPYIFRIGRYGKWQKGVLTHHVHEEIDHALQSVR